MRGTLFIGIAERMGWWLELLAAILPPRGERQGIRPDARVPVPCHTFSILCAQKKMVLFLLKPV